ncbi:hypothetical protein MKW94_029180 [Papaver nudicaule]|uniref:Uncharacterized protein n=1 Tax=Papaver nudicaule TaxID=74823 RepID=A0AA41S142_PAPNU|nr:hypothetical protein [Papaver nudicaule]
MAKTHHLGFPPLLVGFLLVLFVSDLGCVQVVLCNHEVTPCEYNVFCEGWCADQGFPMLGCV